MNRTFILREIENIRTETNNFDDDKFKDFSFRDICKDACDIDFETIGDYELLYFYKKLIDMWHPSFSDCAVSKCVCGGNAEVNYEVDSNKLSSGYACVKCDKCGLEINQSSNNLDFDGVTLSTLKNSVLKSWNEIVNIK